MARPNRAIGGRYGSHIAIRTRIVGIDGSKAALRAALWAVDEAVSRDTPLRLVHVAPASGHGLDEALAEAKTPA